MGERAKEINYNSIRGTEDLISIKRIFTRVDTVPVTGSMLAEILDDVPEVFKNGRFIITDTKDQGRIGMINPKDTGIRIEYIDLATGNRDRIAIGDIEDKMGFHQCMNILNGRGNTREILGDMAKKAGQATVKFAKGSGKDGAKKVGKVAWSGTKKVGKGALDFLNWVGSTEEERRNMGGR